ncbi:MAG: metallophosphoesterase family protein [Candidatus Margulisiibacteriota bacterium]
MLYGVMSDIHGNLEALNAVLLQMGSVERILCLGDIVGYGPNPNECVAVIRDKKALCVAGNHDKAVLGEIDMSHFPPDGQEAVIWTLSEIKKENLDFLKSLPLEVREDDFIGVHGSLNNHLHEYITNVRESVPTFEIMDKSICFVGHLHRPFIIQKDIKGNYDADVLKDGQEVDIANIYKAIINSGSVGQPRDGDPRASFCLYDSIKKIVKIKKVDYDIVSVQDKMKKAGLSSGLIDILSAGG